LFAAPLRLIILAKPAIIRTKLHIAKTRSAVLAGHLQPRTPTTATSLTLRGWPTQPACVAVVVGCRGVGAGLGLLGCGGVAWCRCCSAVCAGGRSACRLLACFVRSCPGSVRAGCFRFVACRSRSVGGCRVCPTINLQPVCVSSPLCSYTYATPSHHLPRWSTTKSTGYQP
jgi:hypothetical protein